MKWFWVLVAILSLVRTVYGFVGTKGIRFTLNGTPWYCSGTNAYYAGLKYIMSDSDVDVMMKLHAQRGVNVMRVFAHSNFDSVPDAMMPSFGQYNEESIRRLDLAVATAGKYEIRLILVFSNYWEFTGGVQEWVDKGLGSGKSLNLFYTDSTLKGYFKDWMQHIITRRNTVSGIKYTEDPTIMAWELMNEPRSSGKNTRIICDWVWEMARFIKSLDANHLVCTGEEGFLHDPNAKEPNAWIDNGYEGVDYWCNIQSPDIDFATLHAYPDQWGMKPPDGYTWLADNFFKRRAQLAHSLGKPIILEEYGQAKNFFGDRDTLLDWIHRQANDNQFGCTLVWAVTTRGSDGTVYGKDDQGYVFLYGDDGSVALKIQIVQMKINMINDTINALKEQQG